MVSNKVMPICIGRERSVHNCIRHRTTLRGEKETVDPVCICTDFPENQKDSQEKDTQKGNLSMMIFVLAKILFLDRQRVVILHILRFHRLIPPKVV